MSTVVTKQRVDLDKIFTFIINNPQCLLTPAVPAVIFKILIGSISFLHSIDCDKRSQRWMLMRLIPICLYLLSFYRFGKQIAIRMLQGTSLKLSKLQWIGFMISMIGHLFRMYCNHIMGHEFTFVLISDGPYKYIRHPRYAAIYLYGFGDCLFMRDKLIYLSLLIRMILYPQRMKNEEKMLTEFFQDDYEEYKKCVPYRILPGIY